MSDCPCIHQNPDICPCTVIDVIEIPDAELAQIEKNMAIATGQATEQ